MGHLSVLWDLDYYRSEYGNSPFQYPEIHISYIGIRDCSVFMFGNSVCKVFEVWDYWSMSGYYMKMFICMELMFYVCNM